MFIGNRIRQLREQKGISRDDIEQSSGLDHSYIARIEQGRTTPPLETLERIAAALSVPLDSLFYAEEDHPAPVSVCASSLEWRRESTPAEVQLAKRLEEVSGAPFEADPAFLVEFARRSTIGKLEN